MKYNIDEEFLETIVLECRQQTSAKRAARLKVQGISMHINVSGPFCIIITVSNNIFLFFLGVCPDRALHMLN